MELISRLVNREGPVLARVEKVKQSIRSWKAVEDPICWGGPTILEFKA
jgi:hypothetical protein